MDQLNSILTTPKLKLFYASNITGIYKAVQLEYIVL